MAETSNRTNGEGVDRAALAERERELRERERQALRTEAGIDEKEFARMKLFAQLIGDVVCEHVEEALDGAEPGSKSKSVNRVTREGERRGFRFL